MNADASLALGEARSTKGITRRSLSLRIGRDLVTGNLWQSESSETRSVSLALLAHGASHASDANYIDSLARAVVAREGVVAISLDAPRHGKRRRSPFAPSPIVMARFIVDWSRRGAELTEQYVTEWRTLLDCAEEALARPVRNVAWWGVSLGTILGLPLLAREPRIGSAVLGLMGLLGPTRDLLETSARSVGVPVLFLVQRDDQFFRVESANRLFEAIASTEKRLESYPGKHGEMPTEAFIQAVAFLGEHLAR